MPLPLLEKIHARFSWFDAVKSSIAKVGVPVLVTSLALTGSILGIRHLGFLQGAELAAYDRFVQSQPDKEKDDRLLIVGIDEIDLQTLQEWPISDRTLAAVIKKLEAAQPRAIGIDVFRDIPTEPGRAELLKQLQQSDRVVIVCKANSEREFGAAPPPGLPLDKVGTADLVIDPGGILRRSLLWLNPPANSGLIIKKHLCNDSENTLLSLSFNLALVYLQKLNIEPEVTPAGDLKLGSTILPKFQSDMGGYRKADAGGYQLMLRYRAQDTPATQVRLTDVLNGKVAPDLIRDRIVLVGYTTPLAKDDFYTPYSASKRDLQKMPGVIVHAQSVSQILGAALDRQPLIWVWSFPVEVLWIFGWSLLGGTLAWYLRHPFGFSVVVAASSGAVYCLALLIFFQGGWIPVVPAIAAFISTAVGVVLLDRFNNSAYGQTVYKTVKTFLKLEVDIDEEKLEKQVAEITESDYFQDLKDTVKSLREQRHTLSDDSSFSSDAQKTTKANEAGSNTKSLTSVDFFNPKQATSTNAQEAEAYEFDFVKALKQESKALKEGSAPLDAADFKLNFVQELEEGNQYPKEHTALLSADPNAKTLDVTHQSRQEGHSVEADADPATQADVEAGSQSYQAFTLGGSFSAIDETAEALDYLDSLQQESQQLKNHLAEDKGA